MLSYKEEDIKLAVKILDELSVTGLRGMRQIIAIAEILTKPLPAGDEEGKGGTEDGCH